jgi:hypothetical protein
VCAAALARRVLLPRPVDVILAPLLVTAAMSVMRKEGIQSSAISDVALILVQVRGGTRSYILAPRPGLLPLLLPARTGSLQMLDRCEDVDGVGAPDAAVNALNTVVTGGAITPAASEEEESAAAGGTPKLAKRKSVAGTATGSTASLAASPAPKRGVTASTKVLVRQVSSESVRGVEQRMLECEVSSAAGISCGVGSERAPCEPCGSHCVCEPGSQEARDSVVLLFLEQSAVDCRARRWRRQRAVLCSREFCRPARSSSPGATYDAGCQYGR